MHVLPWWHDELLSLTMSAPLVARLPCLPSSVTSSPIRICTNSYDDTANIRAEILLLKSIQSDNNTEMSNEIKRLNSEINSLNILEDKCEKSEQQISDLEKLSGLFNKHVKSIIKTQKDTDESVKKNDFISRCG